MSTFLPPYPIALNDKLSFISNTFGSFFLSASVISAWLIVILKKKQRSEEIRTLKGMSWKQTISFVYLYKYISFVYVFMDIYAHREQERCTESKPKHTSIIRAICESPKTNANSFKAILYNRSINNIFSLWLGIQTQSFTSQKIGQRIMVIICLIIRQGVWQARSHGLWFFCLGWQLRSHWCHNAAKLSGKSETGFGKTPLIITYNL